MIGMPHTSIEPIVLPTVCAQDPASHVVVNEGETLIERSVLQGGIRVITQQVPATHSVSIGMWIGAGSRDEHSGHFGSTHYLEHLLFKGTKRYSAFDISNAFDAVGGDANAATGKEQTHYVARILAHDLPMAVDVLADMVSQPLLTQEDFDMERTVILEELAASADDPQDVAYEQWFTQIFADQDLGRPVGGTKQTVLATPRQAVIDHYQRAYQPDGLVVAAAGNVDHLALCKLVVEKLAHSDWDIRQNVPPRAGRSQADLPITAASTCDLLRDGEQTHLIVGARSIRATDTRRPVMSILLTALGGGMSSRLFQEVREKRGLAYTAYAFDSAYTDAGAFAMYAGCAANHVAEVEKVMIGQLEDIATHGLGADERRRVMGQLRGSIALDMEGNGSRMSRLGRSETLHGRIYTIDQTLERLRRVTNDDIRALAQLLLERPRIRTCVGPHV